MKIIIIDTKTETYQLLFRIYMLQQEALCYSEVSLFLTRWYVVKVILRYEKAYPAVVLLSKIFSIHITLGNGIIGIDGQCSVSNLNWQTVFEIQKANLANIFQLAACLANLSFFKSRITTRPPPKNCKWPCTNLALLIKVSSRLHPNMHAPILNSGWNWLFLTYQKKLAISDKTFQNWNHYYEIYTCTTTRKLKFILL
jgi:hypothetical protein